MVKKCTTISVVFLCLCCISVAEDKQSNNSFEKYKIIAAKNIFSRSRTSPKSEDEQKEKIEDAKKFVFEAFALRGTAIQSRHKSAMIENVFNNEIFTAVQGQEFEGWLIEQVQKDKIVITKAEKSQEIVIGRQFDQAGLIQSEEAALEKELEASPKDKAISESDSSDDELIRKMMERRKQELGK